jgi:hypothetical protein
LQPRYARRKISRLKAVEHEKGNKDIKLLGRLQRLLATLPKCYLPYRLG